MVFHTENYFDGGFKHFNKFSLNQNDDDKKLYILI